MEFIKDKGGRSYTILDETQPMGNIAVIQGKAYLEMDNDYQLSREDIKEISEFMEEVER